MKNIAFRKLFFNQIFTTLFLNCLITFTVSSFFWFSTFVVFSFFSFFILYLFRVINLFAWKIYDIWSFFGPLWRWSFFLFLFRTIQVLTFTSWLTISALNWIWLTNRLIFRTTNWSRVDHILIFVFEISVIILLVWLLNAFILIIVFEFWIWVEITFLLLIFFFFLQILFVLIHLRFFCIIGRCLIKRQLFIFWFLKRVFTINLWIQGPFLLLSRVCPRVYLFIFLNFTFILRLGHWIIKEQLCIWILLWTHIKPFVGFWLILVHSRPFLAHFGLIL